MAKKVATTDFQELFSAIDELEREYKIEREYIYSVLESALLTAYKQVRGIKDKNLSNVKVSIDPEKGDVKIFEYKKVVENVKDRRNEISLEDARKIDKRYQVGDVVAIEVPISDFSRKAAMTVRQTVIGKIREKKRNIIFEDYSAKIDNIVTGVIQRIDKKNVIVEIEGGKVEAILPMEEQIPGEEYKPGTMMKFYLVDVKIPPKEKEPIVYLSRTHPNLIRRLMENEVPEIQEGIIEIKAIAREAGSRSKVAVYSNSSRIDPIGACVGEKGIRIQNVLKHLGNEKIDIVKWSNDIGEFIKNALSPAEVVHIDLNLVEKKAFVLVPNDQLSLAIGKGGQNARLTAKLTGWKIDIKGK
ncbi:transcription termination factor NusA [Caldicellulosiruptor morganii]|uniref:Transcription termination/antitermination protein NusA n=1 Tax=Caldicellulosiruptor morganii TaxID=1387555 RepID=A0ABY7BRN0_9FIRM|nr:transcription termination factor NusA [Caldicellulosiruptor morganii]WAM34781.1 transcription termination factor NusA [Caldicellulosiruptor morganii]